MQSNVYLVVGFDKEVFACYSKRLSALRHAKAWNCFEGAKNYRVVQIPVWDEAVYKDYQEGNVK